MDRKWARPLHLHELNIYGKDFEAPFECYEAWIASRSFFFCLSVVDINCRPNEKNIRSVLSLLLTDTISFDRIRENEIREWDLKPFRESQTSPPMLYYSSFSIKGDKKKSEIMYRSAIRYFIDLYRHLLLEKNISAFSIAANEQGARHLERIGFVRLESRYLDRYPIYRGCCGTAAVKAWQRLLMCQSVLAV